MKIIIEIDCEVEGEWNEEYEDELIQGIPLPGVVVCGEDDDDGCDIIFKAVTWTVRMMG